MEISKRRKNCIFISTITPWCDQDPKSEDIVCERSGNKQDGKSCKGEKLKSKGRKEIETRITLISQSCFTFSFTAFDTLPETDLLYRCSFINVENL